ncbi:hypothetical protein RJ639_029298 [Escallonia herrerae]|uniref:USP domain-containing protein n=1 Tax=Escallonia herrerae TaxID=1293975 RepID=A0AA89BDQ0_9ASTE|nr:hypothetical protein RJ639_029298 [Escallonia herrerae]
MKSVNGSADCQRSHWNSGHKTKCKQSASVKRGWITSTAVPRVKQLKKILFPYEEFVELFNWEIPGFRPCGLLNCGNSCFANVVLQCLAYTRPLVAYLLEKGHRRECRRNDWCFLCEFQTHLERASKSVNPFSPINILSRLPNIGGNFGYGKQEDAHEFMRFAIDTMQSVCLDEFGGEKAVHPSSQETTLIQHIFGGHLQSQVKPFFVLQCYNWKLARFLGQEEIRLKTADYKGGEVICTECNVISNQFESMMDLTVEIQGEAASLEECLDQFTAKEWLHGENMYKCDGFWQDTLPKMPASLPWLALKGRFKQKDKLKEWEDE